MTSTRPRALTVHFFGLLPIFLRNDGKDAPAPAADKRSAAAFSFFSRGRRESVGHYRADIDGLRAIAVLGVILLHAGVETLQGGFLGVDVFFVISGFLVHQQVATRLDAHRFSLFAFYGRRIRRTFPALFFVAAVTMAAGALLLMPGDFDALSRSVIAAGLGVSNILFAMQAGYFDHSAITKPLLHTWSLGVEEQFYLVAPIIPFAIRRFSKRARCAILLGLFAVNLIFCIIVQGIIPEVTFFMMPPRLWEFLLGSLVAEGFFPHIKQTWIAELVGAGALTALLISPVMISGAAAHPGLVTLLPCLATALLIHLGGTTPSVANRLLGLAPLAFCGLISYSLYLWHWPMIVFARYADWAFTPPLLIVGAALLFGLSILSWKYIETPFRDPASPFKRHAVPILLSGLCLLVVSSSAVVAGHGWPMRFSPDVAAITSYYDYGARRDFREGSCFITTKYGTPRDFDRRTCLRLSADKPNYLLIGDSHGAHFWVGLSRVFPKINLLQATASGCKPLIGTQGLRYCVDLMHEVLIDFLPHAKLDGVIFAAAWEAPDLALLKSTLAYTQAYVPNVIVFGDIPSHKVDLPNLLGRSLVEHRPELVIENQWSYPFDIDQEYEPLLGPANYVSLSDLLCPQHRCIVYAGKDIPLQFDASHLTTEGSIFVAQKLAELPRFADLVEGRSLIRK